MRFTRLALALVAVALALTGFCAAMSRTLIPPRLEGSVEARRPTGEWRNPASDTYFVTVGGRTYVASAEAAALLEPGATPDKPAWGRELAGDGGPRLGLGGDLPRLVGAYLVVLMALAFLLLRPRATGEPSGPNPASPQPDESPGEVG